MADIFIKRHLHALHIHRIMCSTEKINIVLVERVVRNLRISWADVSLEALTSIGCCNVKFNGSN